MRHFLRAAATLRVVFVVLILCGASSASAGRRDPYEVLGSVGLERDLKEGFTLRADTWSGDLPAGSSKRIEYTLLRGNNYHFYTYTTTKGAKISFHIQDRDGAVVETRSWQKDKDDLCLAGAEILPPATGSYSLVIMAEPSPAERSDWTLVYVFK